MTKMDWSLEYGDNGYWVRRVRDTGETDDDNKPILCKSNIYFKELKDAANAIHVSIDLIVKQAEKDASPSKK